MKVESEGKGRRVTIDLTAAATQEVDRLREITGLTTSDLFRNAISLFRLYVEARSRGHQLCIVDPQNENAIRTRVELPVFIAQPSPVSEVRQKEQAGERQ
jgi:hypothetical protein